MSTNTEFLNLVVPEGTDVPDITELNVNWHTIDQTTAAIIGEIRDTSKIDTVAQKIDNVNNKLGTPEDKGATTNAGTVFGKLNRLIQDINTHVGNWTSARATAIDTINTQVATNTNAIGTTTDSGGNNSQGTIFAKLNKIINELAAHITRWGADKASKVDSINTAVATNNTANATGTLSQKLSQLIVDVAKIPTTQVDNQKVPRSYNSIYLLAKNTTNTILNVSGAGQFHCAFGEYLNGNACSAITVNMDGQDYEITVPDTGKYMYRSVITEDAPNPLSIRDALTSAYDMPLPLNFKQNLRITIKTYDKSISQFYVTVNYDLLV